MESTKINESTGVTGYFQKKIYDKKFVTVSCVL